MSEEAKFVLKACIAMLLGSLLAHYLNKPPKY